MVIGEKTYTVEEFWEFVHLPENSDKRFELVRGRVVEMSPSSTKHGVYAQRLATFISNFVITHKLGYTTASESGFDLQLADDKPTIRAPDIGFFSKERFSKLPDEGFARFAPDLVVEVVSPNDKATEIHEKIDDYKEAGVKLIWIVYPKHQKVDVYTPDTTTHLGAEDMLSGGEVLPGFEIEVSAIFDLAL